MKNRTGAVLSAVGVASLIASFLFTSLWSRTAAGNPAANPGAAQEPAANSRVTVRAAGRGNPRINMLDGREVSVSYAGAAIVLDALQQNLAQPLSMASANFDDDRVADLATGYRVETGGVISIQRGNIDSLFLPSATALAVPESPDFIKAGDFDGDHRADIITAARGGNGFYLLAGDGRGGFNQPQRRELPGKVTALATGEIGRADGMADIVVTVNDAGKSRALVFQNIMGASNSAPVSYSLRGEVSSVAIGQLNEDYSYDIVATAGRELAIIYGASESAPSRTARVALSQAARSVEVGYFGEDRQMRMAILFENGSVQLMSRAAAKNGKKSAKESWKGEPFANGSWPQAVQIARAKISSGSAEDIVVVDPANRKLHILSAKVTEQGANGQAATSQAVPLDVEGVPISVLPMHLNGDRLSDLPVLINGHNAISVVPTAALATFTVNTLADDVDGGGCQASPGDCTLREAINDANSNAGFDQIVFSVTGTINVGSSGLGALPLITDRVSINGGVTGNITVNGSLAGPFASGFRFSGSVANLSSINSLVINEFAGDGISINVNSLDITENLITANGGWGIFICCSSFTSIANNTITLNGRAGIVVAVGTDNSITSNSIFSNGNLGIDLNFNSVVDENDTGDGDAGANRTQNFPVLTSAVNTGGSTIITGALNSVANTSFVIEFFSNSECDPSGNGEGETPIGSIEVTTDASGNASFSFDRSPAIPFGRLITATATRCVVIAPSAPEGVFCVPGDTSEYSDCIPVEEVIVRDADLEVTKSASPTRLNAGETTTYSIVVTNRGPAIATDIRFSDQLPAQTTLVSCSVRVEETPLENACRGVGNNVEIQIPVLAQLQRAFITLVVRLNQSVSSLPACTPIVNTATVRLSDIVFEDPGDPEDSPGKLTIIVMDPNPNNNFASATIRVNCPRVDINCPGPISQPADANDCSRAVTFATPTATGGIPQVNVTCVPPSGTRFPVGTTTVGCVARDAENDIDSCQFTVTITATLRLQIVAPAGNRLVFDPVNLTGAPPANPQELIVRVRNNSCSSAAVLPLRVNAITRNTNSGQLDNNDDRQTFEVVGDLTTPLALNTERELRVRFRPVLPPVARGSRRPNATEVIPDEFESLLVIGLGTAGEPTSLVSVTLVGRTVPALKLIDPDNTANSPRVEFTRSGNEFSVKFYAHDPNKNFQRAFYEFLKADGTPIGDPTENTVTVDLTSLNGSNVFLRGESIGVRQRFTGALSNPEVTQVRVQVEDERGRSVQVTAQLGTGNALILNRSRRPVIDMPVVRLGGKR